MDLSTEFPRWSNGERPANQHRLDVHAAVSQTIKIAPAVRTVTDRTDDSSRFSWHQETETTCAIRSGLRTPVTVRGGTKPVTSKRDDRVGRQILVRPLDDLGFLGEQHDLVVPAELVKQTKYRAGSFRVRLYGDIIEYEWN